MELFIGILLVIYIVVAYILNKNDHSEDNKEEYTDSITQEKDNKRTPVRSYEEFEKYVISRKHDNCPIEILMPHRQE